VLAVAYGGAAVTKVLLARNLSVRGAAAALLACALAGCGMLSVPPTFRDVAVHPQPIPAAAAAYYEIAWLAPDLLAVVAPLGDTESSVSLIDLDGRGIGTVRLLDKRPACVVRIVAALTRLPTSELGFAETCVLDSSNPPTTSELFAYDIQAQRARSLGPTSEPPKVMTWANDMSSAVYTAEGSLCATLYTHDGTDGPFLTEVTVQGRRIPLGEDLAKADDRCTHQGNADYPAYSRDGRTLAAFASSTGSASGLARIGLRWALVLVLGVGSS
jgi:hypothetical protein